MEGAARSWGARRIAALVLLSCCCGASPPPERASPAGSASPPVAWGAAEHSPGSWLSLQPNCARQRRDPVRLAAGRLLEGSAWRFYALSLSLRGGDESEAGLQQMEHSSSSDGPNLDFEEGSSKGKGTGAAGDGAGGDQDPVQPGSSVLEESIADGEVISEYEASTEEESASSAPKRKDWGRQEKREVQQEVVRSPHPGMEPDDASAEQDDREEAEMPFFNGVRVRCLFVDEDSGDREWCDGTIRYLKRSSDELRVRFDKVPAWEASCDLYWPIDDADIEIVTGQEGAGGGSDEARLALSQELVLSAKECRWKAFRKALWLGGNTSYPAPDIQGYTAMHLVALKGDPDMICNSHARMHLVALKDDPDMVRQVVLRKGDVNGVAANGDTPLHCAVVSGSEATVRALLKRGADPHAHNLEFLQPIDVAQVMGCRDVEQVLDKVMQRVVPLGS